MRILVTAIGSISGSFVIETIKNMGMEVVGVDIYPKEWVATSKEVDFFHQVPPVKKTNLYQERIMELCLQHQIQMIIPLIDIEVDYFCQRKEEYARKGIVVTVSNEETIQLVRNKLKVFNTFKNSRLNVIPTYTKKDYIEKCNIFPCVAKIITGRSSEGLHVLENKNELMNSVLRDNMYVFQPVIKGEIIVVDILKTFSGKVIYIARQELTRTKNGAGIAVEIVRDEKIGEIIQYFCDHVNFEGCINIEFIKNKSKYILMDINPRFSAGVAFSNIAGYNFVKNNVNNFLGKTIEDLEDVEFGKIITRKYIEVIV